MISKIAIRYLLVVLLGGFAIPTFAQYNSNVQGTVTDQSGGLVPKAKVTLHNLETDLDAVTETNDTGNYRFNAIPPGHYQVIVEASGFARKVTAVTVLTNQLAGVDVTVAPATATEHIVVTTEAPVLNPDETRVQATLQQSEIQQLPLQNGSILAVMRVAPGVTGIDEDRNLSIISIGGVNPNASSNGKSSYSDSFTMDGASIQSNSSGGNTLGSAATVEVTPNSDMIQEVSLETNTYAVDNGVGSSLRVNITSKAGTNDWHGDGQFRYTSAGLNAVPYTPRALNEAHVPMSRKWWTGTIGGPIWKDHTFVFFSYLHQTQQLSTTSAVQYMDPQFVSWAAQNFPNSIDVNQLMVPFEADKATFQNVANYGSSFGGTAPNCTFPIKPSQEFWAPATSQVPIPCNMPVLDNGVFSQQPKVDGWQLMSRVDQYFRGGKDRFYVSFFKSPQTSDFLWDVSKYNAHTPSDTKYFNINYTHTFTPTMLNQLSLNYQHYSGSFSGSQANGIPFLTLILGLGDPFGDTGGSVNPYFGTPGSPSNSKEQNHALRDDLIWAKERHNLKFGFTAIRNATFNNQAGWLSKPEVPIFLNWSDFFLDTPASYSIPATFNAATGAWQGFVSGADVWNYGLYAQDEWKIRPDLLLTFGLRWDDYGNPGRWGHGTLPFAQVFLGAGTTYEQQIAASYVKPVGNTFSGAMDKNVLPRLGVAWSPGGSHKWSIRGGIGLFEDQLGLSNVTSSLPSQPPEALGLSFSTSLPQFLDAAGTVPNPLATPSAANLYGNNPTGAAPFGFNYVPIKPLGFDSRGGVIQYIDPKTGAVTLYPVNVSGNDWKLSPQKTLNYSISVERELPSNIVLGVSYTGSRSWDLFYSGDFNDVVGDLLPTATTSWGTLNRPTSEWGNVTMLRNGYDAHYNALIILARRTRGNLTVQASYTRGDAEGDQTAGDSYSSVSGPLPFNVTNRFSASATYSLPTYVKEGWAKPLVEGWEISGLGVAQSGTPFTIMTTASFPGSPCAPSCSPASDGDFLANNAGNGNGGVSIPSLAYNVKGTGFSEKDYLYGIVPTTAFMVPTGYGTSTMVPQQGNEPWNMFRNPGYFAIDMALNKKFTFPWFQDRKCFLKLGGEATNIFNHVNLGPVQNNLSQGNFGQVTTANQSRVLQLVARFEF